MLSLIYVTFGSLQNLREKVNRDFYVNCDIYHLTLTGPVL